MGGPGDEEGPEAVGDPGDEEGPDGKVDSVAEVVEVIDEIAARVIVIVEPEAVAGATKDVLAIRSDWVRLLKQEQYAECVIRAWRAMRVAMSPEDEADAHFELSVTTQGYLEQVEGLLAGLVGRDRRLKMLFSLGYWLEQGACPPIDVGRLLSGLVCRSEIVGVAPGSRPAPTEWPGMVRAYWAKVPMPVPLPDAFLDLQGEVPGAEALRIVDEVAAAAWEGCLRLEAGDAPAPDGARVEPMPVPAVPLSGGPAEADRHVQGEGQSDRDGGTPSPCGPVITAEEFRRLRAIKDRIDPRNTYIGSSMPLLRVFERIDLLNRSPEKPVLILGSSGSGKSAIAELIHRSSGREGPFCKEHASGNVAQDLASVRSRWVGTGRNSGLPDRAGETPGLLREFARGTIFVDEVGDITDCFQLFLQQVIDKDQVRANFGDLPPFVPDVRLILATLKDLEEEVRARRFRSDLLRRLRGRILRIPDLVERREDIFDFVRHLIPGRTPEPSFLLALLEHDWPGQVGELKDVLEEVKDRFGKTEGPLTLDHLPMLPRPIISRLKALGPREVKGRLYLKLAAMLISQGFEKGRGLHIEMKKFLYVSEPTISRWGMINVDDRPRGGRSTG